MISGINHLTFAVRNLSRSFQFYVQVLEFRPIAIWNTGAYLTCGEIWIALTLDEEARLRPHPDYTHTAFSVTPEQFPIISEKIRGSAAPIWQENQSEGDSLYFLDPDGHKLELHASDLAQRLKSMRRTPPDGVRFFDQP